MIPRGSIYPTVAAGACFGAALLILAGVLISTGTFAGGLFALILGIVGAGCCFGAATIALEARAVESRRPMAVRKGEGDQ